MEFFVVENLNLILDGCTGDQCQDQYPQVKFYFRVTQKRLNFKNNLKVF